MRLDPLRKPEGLGGDAEGVRAELVPPRESSGGRCIHCDIPDEDDGECDGTYRCGRTPYPRPALVQREQDDESRGEQSDPNGREGPRTVRCSSPIAGHRQWKTHQVARCDHERPQEVRSEGGFLQPANYRKEERDRDDDRRGD